MKQEAKIRRYMDSRGISEEELAYKTGIPYSSLHMLVNGYRVNPRLSRIKVLLETLECDFNDLF